MEQKVLAPASKSRIRSFFIPIRLWWGSQFFWYATRWMEMAASGWLMLVLTDSPAQVALLGFYRITPFLIFGLFSGAITERFSRRNVLLGAQIVNTLLTGTLTVLLFTNLIAPWHVALAAFISGLIWALEWPVRRSATSDLVGVEHITPAIVFENILSGLTKISGPLAIGALIGFYGLGVAYSFMTAFFILSVIELLLIQLPAHERLERQPNLLRQIAAGLRYVKGEQVMLGVMFITIIMNVFGFPYTQMLPVFARDILHAGPTGLGILGAVDGVGTLIGSLMLRFYSTRIRGAEGRIYIIGSLSMVLAVLAFSLSTIFEISALLLLSAGFGMACFSAFQSTIILRTVSLEMRARVLGVLVLCIGSAPLGSIWLSILSAWGGPATAVTISAGMGIIGLLASAVFFPGLRKR